MTDNERADLVDRFGTFHFGKVIERPERRAAADIAEQLYGYGLIGLVSDDLVNVANAGNGSKDERLIYVRWGEDGAENPDFAERIDQATLGKSGALFGAARKLLDVANYQHVPDWLAVFSTVPSGSIKMHKDGQDRAGSSEYWAGMTRDFLALRGERRIKLAEDADGLNEAIVQVMPGEGYSLMPFDHFHAVRYVGDVCLALYVQSHPDLTKGDVTGS